jgi:hypothetical protein
MPPRSGQGMTDSPLPGLSTSRNPPALEHAHQSMHQMLQINDVAPDFEADTIEGNIRFHSGSRQVGVLFSRPKDTGESVGR